MLCTRVCSDVSQAADEEADEGRGRCGAAGTLWGLWSVSQDERQQRLQEHGEQTVSIGSGSLLPVQRVGGGERDPREGPRGLVGQTGLRPPPAPPLSAKSSSPVTSSSSCSRTSFLRSWPGRPSWSGSC